MLDKEFLKELKQTNVSADSVKTKERLYDIWRTCGKDGRQRMADMIDAAVSTFHSAVLKGRISAKLAIPMAVVGDVDPAYLSAETDIPSSCSDEKIDGFLAAHGYEKPSKPRGRKRAADAPAPVKTRVPRKRKEEAAEPLAETEPPEFVFDQSDADDVTILTWEDEEEDEDIGEASFIDPEISELMAVADEKIATFDPDKFAALDDLSFSDIEVLIRSLEIKMSASDSARTLMRLVRLLLV